MKMKRLGPVRAACVALALLALSGCSYFYPTPPVAPFEPLDHQELRRFDRVADGVYRGSQPKTAKQIQSLIDQHGIKTILKLNSGSDPAPSQVKVIHHSLNAWVTPSKEEIQKILDDIDSAEKPVYVHCSFGEDRTGLIVALYKVRHKISSPEDAYKDMVAHGFHPYHGVWSAWVREVGWQPAP